MRSVDVQDGEIDLALLRFLRALIETGSITRAGQTLDMSQPAASRAVARLRERLGDPLLVRTGRGWVLTPLAVSLAEPVRHALSAVGALFDLAVFDAATTTRRFRMASTDYGMATVVHDILRGLTAAAPHADLVIDAWSDETIGRLERGELDAALYADEPIPADFHYRPLFEDGYAVVCRADHALARGGMRRAGRALLDAARAWPHFAPRYPAGRTFATDNVYARIGLPSPRYVLEAPFFEAGLTAVANAGLLAVLPERMARRWNDRASLAILPIRIRELRFQYRMIWHERAHRDPGMRWLRQALARHCQGPP